MVALDVAHLKGLDFGADRVAAQLQAVGGEVIELVAPGLGFEAQGKGRITGNVDGGDMVHLDADFEGHVRSFVEGTCCRFPTMPHRPCH